MLGGYKLIDFGGVDISTSKTISGIYNEIEKTKKRIVGCNLKLGTTTFKELTLDVKKDGTNLVLSNSIIKVTITNANAVVGEEASGDILIDVGVVYPDNYTPKTVVDGIYSYIKSNLDKSIKIKYELKERRSDDDPYKTWAKGITSCSAMPISPIYSLETELVLTIFIGFGGMNSDAGLVVLKITKNDEVTFICSGPLEE